MHSQVTAAIMSESLPGRPLPVRRRRVFEEIASELEAQIADGEFVAGGQLPSERALMERFAVSRTSVREALFQLQRAGFIEINNGTRARVTKPSPEALLSQLSGVARQFAGEANGIADLQEARALFECGLVRHAARHATPKQIEKLGLALERNRESITKLDAFSRTDLAFHLVIAEMPGNPIFTSLHVAFSGWLADQRTTGLTISGAAEDASRAHQAIYNGIAEHDPNQAEEAMAKHLAQVSRYFWQARTAEPDAADRGGHAANRHSSEHFRGRPRSSESPSHDSTRYARQPR